MTQVLNGVASSRIATLECAEPRMRRIIKARATSRVLDLTGMAATCRARPPDPQVQSRRSNAIAFIRDELSPKPLTRPDASRLNARKPSGPSKASVMAGLSGPASSA